MSLCGTEMAKYLDSCVSHFCAIAAVRSKLSGNKTLTDAKSQTQNDLLWRRKVNRAQCKTDAVPPPPLSVSLLPIKKMAKTEISLERLKKC